MPLVSPLPMVLFNVSPAKDEGYIDYSLSETCPRFIASPIS